MTKYYAGLDVSMKTTNICVVNDAGKVVFETETKTEPQSIAQVFQGCGYKLEKAGVESGSISHWLTENLKAEGLPVVCVDARKLAAVLSTVLNKTDKNDARGIAIAIKSGFYTVVHQKSMKAVHISTLMASRRSIVNLRTQTKNSIRGLLKAYGIIVRTTGDISFANEVKVVIQGLDPLAKEGIEQLLVAFNTLLERSRHLDQTVSKVSKSNATSKLLQTVQGVGPVTALTYMAEIDDPKRFEQSRSVGAYLGMTPTQYSSGETVRQGRISKWGSTELRSLLTEAALVLLRRTKKWSKLKAWGLRLAARIGMRKAITAVARKLSIVLHRMMLTGETFRYTDKPGEGRDLLLVQS